MKTTFDIFDPDSINDAVAELERASYDLEQCANRICERLATIGAVRASLLFRTNPYVGKNDVQVTVEPVPDGWRINAGGEAVLFIEYGSGKKYGYGHPEPEAYGPGTWPGKGHWNDPKGWILPKSKTGGARVRSFGNPPAAAMYTARQDILALVEQVAEEEFARL